MIFQPEYLAAMIIGFFGSLHCLGMCGPIALVTPSLFPGTFGRILSGLIYNSGRILTYSVMGMIAGLLGRGVVFFKWQQALSLIIGLIILIILFWPKLLNVKWLGAIAANSTNSLKKWMGSFLKKTSITGIFSIGIVNGLLPCGLVYLGLAGSLDMSSASGGAIFMIFFGLGTFPMMTGLHLLGNNLKSSFKNKMSRLVPVFVFLVAFLFIIRGLGLGIPYISPSFDSHSGDIHCTSPAHRHQ